MKEETKNLYLAIVLSIIVIFGVNHFLMPAPKDMPVSSEKEKSLIEKPTEDLEDIAGQNFETVEEVLQKENSAEIESETLKGRIRLKGARFDYLTLLKYNKTLDSESGKVELFAPTGTEMPYFADFGFLAEDSSQVPATDSVWQVQEGKLSPTTPLVLTWDNGQGVVYTREISLDEHYLMTITDKVSNQSGNDLTIYPYGRINRTYNPSEQNARSVVHEGVNAVIDGDSKEIKLSEIKENQDKTFEGQNLWAGFSDRYWLSAFILNGTTNYTLRLSNNGKNNYQIDYRAEPLKIKAGETKTHHLRFFAGAKEIKLLDHYTKENKIEKFDLAIDFGWYYFLTKPFFYILDFLYHLIGNMGWAILLFAALLRLAVFPIANKSYDSMSKMKKLQPKVMALQAQYKDDKTTLQQKTLELYKKEKVNPASGCLPMFIQIPIFFSLYKVLNIAIEIRHAPFIGWIKDLSAPDPLTISVWSHIPLPGIFGILDIGVWPILMGLTMWLQQKLNPAPTNKDQARMFAMMPIIFTLMLGHFASGLVIYWTLSNILSMIQQKAIMYKNGVK